MVVILIAVAVLLTTVLLWIYLRYAKKAAVKDHERMVRIVQEEEMRDAAVASVDASARQDVEAQRDEEARAALEEKREELSKAEPAVELDDAQKVADRLRRAMAEILEAWTLATTTEKPAQSAVGVWSLKYNEAYRTWSLSIDGDAEMLRQEVTNLQERCKAEGAAKADAKTATDAHRPNSERVDRAWKALELAIKDIPSKLDGLPPDMVLLFQAAPHFYSNLDHPIRTVMSNAGHAAQDIKVTVYPETSNAKGRKIVTRVEERLKPAFEAHMKAMSVGAQVQQTFNTLSEVGSSPQVTEPQKPAEEDVRAFVGGYQAWARNRLHAERKALREVDVLKQAQSDYEAAVTAVTKLLPSEEETGGKTPTVIFNAEDAFFIASVKRVLETLKARYNGAYQKLAARTTTDLYPGSDYDSPTPDEEEFINDLLAKARTLGFAVAQRNIAKSKHERANNRRAPRDPATPSVYSLAGVDAYLALFDEYLVKCTANEQETERIKAEQHVTGVAWNTRIAKVEDSSKAVFTANEKAMLKLHDNSSLEFRALTMAMDRITGPYHRR